MYISNIDFRNYGPFENLKIENIIDTNGKPKPIVLIGQNGSGKTICISNILHSLVEIKRGKYNKITEVSDNNYYRLGSHGYVNLNHITSYNRIEYTEGGTFTEVITRDYSDFKSHYSATEYPDVKIEDAYLKDNGFYSNVNFPQVNVFEKEVFLYFPVERYYMPMWENPENNYKIYFSTEKKYVGRSSSNMIRYDVLKDVEEWLLDVIIDRELYERKDFIKDEKGEPLGIYSGRNDVIANLVNSFLTMIFQDKGFESARIAITKREGLFRQIKIVGKRVDEDKEREIMPSINNMSSGEAMVLGIMASILREADRVCDKDSSIQDVRGIVLIDEIDAHLHSDILKDTLPKLIGFFTNIQFVVSSHSPFFLLGMKEHFGDKCIFIELPAGCNVGNIIDFQEIKNSFELVNVTYNQTIEEYKKIINDSNVYSKPYIITEGKTDWMHLKHALCKLQADGKFTDLDVRFHEVEESMGDDKMKKMLMVLSQIHNPYPIIGIFDSDNKIGIQYNKITELGNKVYAFGLVDTQEYGCGISVELLYNREDLTKTWSDGRRMYLSDEFSEKSFRLKSDQNISTYNQTINDANKRKIVKVVDHDVYNDKDEQLAISKFELAKRIMEDKEPYENIKVDGFIRIFEMVEEIIKTCSLVYEI